MESHRLLLGVTVFGVILFTLFFSKPTITGFVPAETFSQSLDMDVSESQRFVLSSEAPLKLSSLSLSGKVNGAGLVNIYLSDGATERLVFSNKRRQGSAIDQITGMASLDISPEQMLERIESLPAGYVAVPGVFNNECRETCILDPALLKNPDLYLDVVVEPGTAVHISGLRFSIFSK
ncbi:Uncharacterised protein [uncultured archaeon]|nr:Uncharacterised protein [uncultured archaeon]